MRVRRGDLGERTLDVGEDDWLVVAMLTGERDGCQVNYIIYKWNYSASGSTAADRESIREGRLVNRRQLINST